MNNRFFKNIIFLLFVNLLIKPFWILGIDRSVQNIVGDTSYGIFLAISNFSYLFYIILDMGLTNFNNRNIAQNHQLLSKHFIGISQAKLFLSLIYFIVIFSIGWLIGYNGEQMKLLAIVGFNQMLLSFILYLRSNISALLLFKTDSILSVLDRMLIIFICGFLLWSGLFPRYNFNIYWYVYSQTVSYLITMAIALFIVLRHTKKLIFRFNLPFIIVIIRKSLPYALLILLMSFYFRLEPVLIERILPPDIASFQVGIFARAYRLFDAGNNITNLFNVILLPLFATMIKQEEDVQSLVKQSLGLIISMTVLISVLCIFYSKDIMHLLYGMQEYETTEIFNKRIEESSHIFQILMTSFVFISISYIFNTLLTANGSLRILNIVAASAVLVNIVLNFIFIPNFKAIGAAYTSLCVHSTACVLQYFIARNKFSLRIKVFFWLKVLIYIICIVTTTLFTTKLNLTWYYSFTIALIIGIGWAIITKLLDIKDLKDLLFSTLAKRQNETKKQQKY